MRRMRSVRYSFMKDSGIYPGERLILTFETGKTVLNMGLAEKLAERYLQ